MKHFNPGDIVVHETTIIRVISMSDNNTFSGNVLSSSFMGINDVGGWNTEVFELHTDLMRLQKLERIFKDETP